MDITLVDYEDVKLAISRAKICLFTKTTVAFFANVLIKLKVKVTTDIPTGATNGIDLLINPDFFRGLTPLEQEFLLLHETMHCVLLHAVRKPTNYDHTLWNVAADYVINLACENFGFKIIKGGLLDHRFAGMTTDEVYKILDNEDNQQKPDFDDLLPPDDAEGEVSKSDEEAQSIESKMTDILASAKTATQMNGQYSPDGLPEELKRFFQELYKPLLNWRVILQRYLNQTVKDRYSLSRFNRRYFPKYKLPSLNSKGLVDIDVLIDTSGSIEPEQFTQFISEIHHVLKMFKPRNINVSQFDHMHRGTQVLKRINDLPKLEFRGGGGTNITESYDIISKTSPKVLIIFTDGHLQVDHLPAKGFDVIWALYGGNTRFNPSVGKVINIKLE